MSGQMRCLRGSGWVVQIDVLPYEPSDMMEQRITWVRLSASVMLALGLGPSSYDTALSTRECVSRFHFPPAPLRACLVACPYWFKESRARRDRCRATVFISNHTFLPMALLLARTKHAHFAHFELHRVLRGGACRMYALGIACL